MKTQYNFKIEDTLKQELEEVQQNSDIQSKEEFLSQLLNSFKQKQANETNTNIDMSQYEEIEANTKTMLSNTFKHIIYTVQANTANMKQQAIGIEKEKLAIIEERTAFKKQIEELKAKHNQDILDMQKKTDEELKANAEKVSTLENQIKEKTAEYTEYMEKTEKETTSLKAELEQVQAIANQVKAVMIENKELRTASQELKRESEDKLSTLQEQSVKELTEANKKVKELEQDKFKREFENEELSKKLKKLQDLEKEIQKTKEENIILSTKLEMLSKKEEL